MKEVLGPTKTQELYVKGECQQWVKSETMS